MPPPFRFKLEKVLEYRRSLEDQAMQALAQAQQAYDSQKGLLESLKARLAEHHESWKQREDFTAQDLWLHDQYTRRMEQDIIEADADLQQMALKLQQARQQVLTRSKDRKLLEKLKTRQAETYHAEEQRKEQREFEEAASLRYEPPDI